MLSTSDPEFSKALEDLLQGVRPRLADSDWDRYIAPFGDDVSAESLVNLFALARARDLKLNAQERQKLDALLAAAGVHDPERDAAAVEIGMREHPAGTSPGAEPGPESRG